MPHEQIKANRTTKVPLLHGIADQHQKSTKLHT